MALGKRPEGRQEGLFVATSDIRRGCGANRWSPSSPKATGCHRHRPPRLRNRRDVRALDGSGLVVKCVEHVRADGGAHELRLKSANSDYADYTCLAEDVHIVGKVPWTVRRV